MKDIQDKSAEERACDAALTRALEAVPLVDVPSGFALRIKAKIAAEAAPARYFRSGHISAKVAVLEQGAAERSSAGRRVALAAAALLVAVFIAISVVLPHPDPAHRIASLVVWTILAVEFVALTLWLSLQSDAVQ